MEATRVADSDDLLARLLRDAATSATPRAVQEAAEDGGHPDDAQLRALEAGELEESKAQSLRRHVLFCDSCTARTVHAGGEPSTRFKGKTKAPTAASPLPAATRRRYRFVFLAIVVVAVVVSGFIVMKVTTPAEKPPEEQEAVIETFFFPRSIGADGVGERGLVRIDERVVLDYQDDRGKTARHIYALMVDDSGRVHALQTDRSPRVVQGLLQVPRDPTGWDIGALTKVAIGQRLVFLLVVSQKAIPALEGEIRDRVTLARIGEALKPLFPLRDDDAEAVVAEVRKFGFGGVTYAVVARVRL